MTNGPDDPNGPDGPDGVSDAGEWEESGGDPACWLSRVCPECGAIADGEPPAVCPRCRGPITGD